MKQQQIIDKISNHLSESSKVKLKTLEQNDTKIAAAVSLILKSLKKGGKIFIAGNGGSAADAQHIAADFVGLFRFDKPIPAIAITTDTSIITALANDFGYQEIF